MAVILLNMIIAFYFKPSFEDRQETQFCWNYNRDDMTALYYNDLMSVGR
jgi:hypothetical protein